MARVTIEDCLDYVDNRFALTILAAKRARELEDGATSLLVESKNKPGVQALREIAAGKVAFDRDIKTLLESWENARN